MVSPAEILQGKILIVDDQKPNIILIEQMLRNAGYSSIFSTLDPQKVCELHLIHHFDLILLDLQMPGMDGFQVMENLKQIEVESYLPVLVITAQPTHKLRALKSGAKDFVSKPFDLTEVLLRVHNMLEVRLLHKRTKSLYERVLEEQKVSKQLLLNVLPQSVVDRLKTHPEASSVAHASPEVIDEGYAEATVLFADIIEFTKFSEGASADVLVEVLRDISRRFERIEKGVEKDKILDGAYLSIVGLSDPIANQTIKASRKAVELIEALERFNSHHRSKLKVRFAFDVGTVANGGHRQLVSDL